MIDFYTQKYDPEEHGYVHKEDLPDLEECKNALEDIASILYSSDALDCEELDNVLSYLVYELRGKMPSGKINIERRATEEEIRIKRLFEYQVGYTRAYAEITCRR